MTSSAMTSTSGSVRACRIGLALLLLTGGNQRLAVGGEAGLTAVAEAAGRTAVGAAAGRTVVGAAAGRTPKPHKAEGFPRELDTYVATALGQWDLPGAAVAVVKDGEVVVARGYGVREMGKPDLV